MYGIKEKKDAKCFPLESFHSFTSSTCQSILPCYPICHSTKYTIADLCIFNKFRREPPFAKLVISDDGQRRRLLGCLAISVLTFIYVRRVHNPPQFFHPIHTILLCFPLSALSCRSCILLLCLYLSSSSFFPSIYCVFFSPVFEQLAFHRSSLYPSSFSASLFSLLTRAALSRALYLGAVSIRVWNMDNRTTRVY